MGTNYSFLLQSWVFLGCCGSLQQNSCKSLVVSGVVVAESKRSRNNVEKSVKIIWRLEKDALYLHQEK